MINLFWIDNEFIYLLPKGRINKFSTHNNNQFEYILIEKEYINF